MHRLLWFPGGRVIHLAQFVGPLRFEGLCAYMGETEPGPDLLWPDVVTVKSWNDPGGRLVHGAWTSDQTEPDWPICLSCKNRWRTRNQDAEEVFARHD